MPHSISLVKLSTPEVAGPIVQMIFVFLMAISAEQWLKMPNTPKMGFNCYYKNKDYLYDFINKRWSWRNEKTNFPSSGYSMPVQMPNGSQLQIGRFINFCYRIIVSITATLCIAPLVFRMIRKTRTWFHRALARARSIVVRRNEVQFWRMGAGKWTYPNSSKRICSP